MIVSSSAIRIRIVVLSVRAGTDLGTQAAARSASVERRRRARRGRARGRSRGRCRRRGRACRRRRRRSRARRRRRAPCRLDPRSSPPPCSSALRNSSLKTSASAVARWPASETGSSVGARPCLPATSPWTSIARSRSISSSRSTSSSRCSVSTSCTAAIARIRLTESSERLAAASTFGGARLEPQQRRDGLQVVLDAVVDLLGEHAAHHRAAVLERDGRLVRDRLEQLPVVVARSGVSRSTTSSPICRPLPAQRQPHGVRAGPALGPGDLAVLEHERGAGRVRPPSIVVFDDRLERLLEVERLRDRLGDPRQRLELVHAPLRLRRRASRARSTARPGDAIATSRSISAWRERRAARACGR